jgi:hypothetical protein
MGRVAHLLLCPQHSGRAARMTEISCAPIGGGRRRGIDAYRTWFGACFPRRTRVLWDNGFCVALCGLGVWCSRWVSRLPYGLGYSRCDFCKGGQVAGPSGSFRSCSADTPSCGLLFRCGLGLVATSRSRCWSACLAMSNRGFLGCQGVLRHQVWGRFLPLV